MLSNRKRDISKQKGQANKNQSMQRPPNAYLNSSIVERSIEKGFDAQHRPTKKASSRNKTSTNKTQVTNNYRPLIQIDQAQLGQLG